MMMFEIGIKGERMSKNISAVSVIIPCYNSSTTIECAVKSVMSQTQLPREIILVDDCSSDDGRTIQILYKLKEENKTCINIIVLELDQNQGTASARNEGMKIAKEDYIAFLDSDDIWVEHKLEKQLEILEKDPEIILIGSNINGNIYNTWFGKRFYYCTPIIFENLIFKNFFPTPTVIIRKKVINIVGYFNSAQRYMEDIEYFMRIAKFGKCILVNESLAICGCGKPVYGYSGLSKNLKAMEIAELNNFKVFYTLGYMHRPIYILSVVYSLIKYFRRILITKLRRIQEYIYLWML